MNSMDSLDYAMYLEAKERTPAEDVWLETYRVQQALSAELHRRSQVVVPHDPLDDAPTLTSW